MLNCKPGDLAILIRSANNNAGKIVRCVRLHSGETHDLDGVRYIGEPSGPRWVIDPPLPVSIGGRTYTAADRNLRPIRGGEGEDEVLRLAGRPVGKPQAA